MSGAIIIARMHETDARLTLIRDWLTRDLGLSYERLEPASSDASFRRYFRVFTLRAAYIVMDAPPEKEDVRPYLEVGALLESLGAHVPHVHERDVARGLLLIEDLGTTPYLARLAAPAGPDALYADALRVLADIQVRGVAAAKMLAPYDREALGRELALMPEWFCRRHLGCEPSATEEEALSSAFEFLITAALAQPQVFVHRDYHSRNLMVVPERNPGIIDFQDALRGPIGYDLVSILKDCYISWPRARVEGWVQDYRALLTERGAAVTSPRQFLRDFDLIGVQRHLKVLGIFARLWHRDGKPGYLLDLPRTLNYVLETCALYSELAPLGAFLERRALPGLAAANANAAARAVRA
jgi:aminoglycoside/choline kinase family phosphotransferase